MSVRLFHLIKSAANNENRESVKLAQNLKNGKIGSSRTNPIMGRSLVIPQSEKGWVSALDLEGRAIWIVDAHRDGKRFMVHADEMLTAFVELQRAIHKFAVEAAIKAAT